MTADMIHFLQFRNHAGNRGIQELAMPAVSIWKSGKNGDVFFFGKKMKGQGNE